MTPKTKSCETKRQQGKGTWFRNLGIRNARIVRCVMAEPSDISIVAATPGEELHLGISPDQLGHFPYFLYDARQIPNVVAKFSCYASSLLFLRLATAPITASPASSMA
jgi:hypothetical protein